MTPLDPLAAVEEGREITPQREAPGSQKDWRLRFGSMSSGESHPRHAPTNLLIPVETKFRPVVTLRCSIRPQDVKPKYRTVCSTRMAAHGIIASMKTISITLRLSEIDDSDDPDARVKQLCQEAANASGLDSHNVYDGPVEFGLLMYSNPPDEWSDEARKAVLAGECDNAQGPCLSGMLADIETALEGIMYQSRSQIFAYTDVDGIPTGKYYTLDEPHSVIVVRYTDEN